MNTDNLKSKLSNKVKDISNEERTIIMQEAVITNTYTNYAALKNNVLDIIKNNLKKQPLSLQLFDIIKSSSGSSTSFTITTLSGETMEKSIMGIILCQSWFKVGCVCVPTAEQNTTRQEVLIKQLGVEKVYVDKISGKSTDRPQNRNMLSFVRNGDTVMAEAISWFARNTGKGSHCFGSFMRRYILSHIVNIQVVQIFLRIKTKLKSFISA